MNEKLISAVLMNGHPNKPLGLQGRLARRRFSGAFAQSLWPVSERNEHW